MSIMIVRDCIRVNIGRAPKGLLAGYVTGSSDIRWGAADWAAHPGAVRIDQDPSASDHTADVLDVEAGAATVASVPGWAKGALASYAAATRPGQRSPLVYASAANLAPVANALTRAGLADGKVGLFVANWNLSQAEAVAQVLAASGPFPVHGIQFKDAGDFDVDVFSAAWLNDVSGAPAKVPVSGTGWVFGQVRNLKVVSAGPESVKLSWDSPVAPAPLGIGSYQVTIRGASGHDIPGYPRSRPKGPNPETWQFGGLPSGASLTAMVRAVATDGGHASPWAAVPFTTPHGT